MLTKTITFLSSAGLAWVRKQAKYRVECESGEARGLAARSRALSWLRHLRACDLGISLFAPLAPPPPPPPPPQKKKPAPATQATALQAITAIR